MMQTPTDTLAVLRDFEGNPVRAGRELRSALRTDSGAFLAALLNETVFADDDRGFRFAVDILISGDMIIPAVATPSGTSFVQALRLTRYMLAIDGNFLNALLTGLMTRDDLTDRGCIIRVLDLIGEYADRLANWRSLIRIHADGDAEIKSRCATLLARYRFRDEAGIELFRRSGPRIRANIIQNLWDVSQVQATEILEVAIHDEDNRVAGNACLALYNSGNTRALCHLADMLRSPESKKRLTAAWVVGECRDGRFAGGLLEGLRGDQPLLRKRAIASLAKLEPISATAADSDLDLCFVTEPLTAPDSAFDFWLKVTNSAGEPVAHLRPVDFFVWSGARPSRANEEFLLDYTVEEFAATSASAVRIVYPVGSEKFEGALKSSLAKKPAAQPWALSSYGGVPAKSSPAIESRFETDASAISALLESGPVVNSDPAEAVNKALVAESELADQHMVLLLDHSAIDLEALRALCESGKTRLHCWRSEEQLAANWPRFLAALSSRYTLRASVMPAAVIVRNAGVKPSRFSSRADLLKGGPHA